MNSAPVHDAFTTTGNRLMSLDALRGFDMFWIIGGSGMVVALTKVLGFPDLWASEIAKQMTHVKWEGFHFLDLIFPLFVFISGVTVPFTLAKRRSSGITTKQLQIQIIKRSVILVLVGVSFSLFHFRWEAIRLYQVLWMIGMSYLIGASVTLHMTSWKARLILFFAVLTTYHLALFHLPYPGKGETLTSTNNLAAWLDRNLIPSNLAWGDSDPEGTIRIFTGGMLGLLGGLIGQRIRSYPRPEVRCGIEIAAGGLGCLLLGWLWSFSFPIIKGLWSPSFVLWAGGWSMLLLALFYVAIDVCRLRWAGWVFLPIGMNAIAVYAAKWYLPLQGCRDFFFQGLAGHFETAAARGLVLSFGLILIQWLVLYGLYRKRLFIRV
ncbi:MAG: DUF5009 domain-containing protein [Verrucomicrobiota bacterium]